MTRHRRSRRHRLRGVLALTVAALVAAFFLPRADAVTPSEDACHTTSNSAPKGDCGRFRQVFRDNFNGRTVPVGTFSSCAGDGDFRCAGLKNYPADYANWGAYPRGWYDTAGNPSEHRGRKLGGEYRADDTVSVRPSATGDGQLRVHMYRPASGGYNHVAALVPRKCMNIRFGKFTERLVVRELTDGYKMAHLHYSPDEIDYPEAGGNFRGDPVSWFTHGFSEDGGDVAPNAAWTHWHTYSQEVTPSGVTFYFDGKRVGHTNGQYPSATPWVLQNESSLDGGTAAPGSFVDIDTTWVTCYRYAG